MSDNTATRIVVLEVVFCIFFAAFIRLDTSDLTNIQSLLPCLLFLFGFALMNASRSKLSLTTLGTLLVVVCLTLQWDVFWSIFFNSCFLNTFASSFTLSLKLIIQTLLCVLCITLSMTDFAGKYTYIQMLAVIMIESIGFSLASASINYGFKTIDGGAGLQVFLLSACLTLGKWLIYFRPDSKLVFRPISTNYPQQGLSLVGLILVILAWPGFNSAGSLFTQTSTLLDISYLQGSAFFTTVLTLSSAVTCTLALPSLFRDESKLNIHHFTDAILSAGFIVASCINVVIDPVVGLVLGCFASITTILIKRLLADKVPLMSIIPGALLRLLYSALGSIVCSVVIIARTNRSPTFSNNLSNQALFIFISLIVTAVIGLAFGCVSGFVMKYFQPPIEKQINKDDTNWLVREDQYPLFRKNQGQQEVLDSVRGGNNRLTNNLLPSYADEMMFKAADKKKQAAQKKEGDSVVDQQPSLEERGSQKNASSPYLKIIRQSVINKSVNYLLYNSNKKNQEGVKVQAESTNPQEQPRKIVSESIP